MQKSLKRGINAKVALKETEKLQRIRDKTPYVRPGVYFMRPEDRCNPRLRFNFPMDFSLMHRDARPRRRIHNYLNDKLMEPNHTEAWLHLHSPRWNFQPLFILFLSGTWLGVIAYYVNHKIMVIEPNWVEDYG